MARLYSRDKVRDLVLLDPITEDNILKALRRRFGKDLIYTYIGMCVCVCDVCRVVCRVCVCDAYCMMYMYLLSLTNRYYLKYAKQHIHTCTHNTQSHTSHTNIPHTHTHTHTHTKGAVLISVNPFKLIRGLYSSSQLNSYKNRYMYEVISLVSLSLSLSHTHVHTRTYTHVTCTSYACSHTHNHTHNTYNHTHTHTDASACVCARRGHVPHVVDGS